MNSRTASSRRDSAAGRLRSIGLGALAAWAWGCGGSPAASPDAGGGTGDHHPPASSAGVVGMSTSGAPVCFPICSNASTDPDGDGFGYENQTSCVVPGSLEARTRVPCTVGAPIPTTVGPPAGSAGAAIDGMCFPLCSVLTTDGDGDGYGFEFGAPCVFPGTPLTVTSLPCKTGMAPPVRDLNGMAGRLLNEVCTPYCTTAGADPDADGFGFEFGGGCIVSGSIPATTMGIDCKVGEDILKPPVTLTANPPVGAVTRPAGVASAGFFVVGGRLYDKFGNDFVMRGVNNPDIWFDAGNQYLAYQALEQIAKAGANTIRIVWKTTGSASNLARVIRRVVELRMVPMVELHDVTGGDSTAGLLDMAAFYRRDDVKQVLLAYEPFLLVNIANEWSGADFRNAYLAAIASLRGAGINHTLVIDSNAFGQSSDTIFADGPALLAGDAQHNLIFSLHMYQDYAATSAGRAHITGALGTAATLHLPLVVGEFGWQLAGVIVDAPLIMSECARLGIGYIAWSWKGNDASLAYLDMAIDWPGTMLTSWGTQVLQGANGIAATAQRASIFTK